MSQNLTDIEIFVANKTGKTLATSRAEIDAAIQGALDEFGSNMELAFAQSIRPIKILANTNSIMLPPGFVQLKSLVISNGTQTVDLSKSNKTPADFDGANAGFETETNDIFDFFMVSGGKMYFGKGLAKADITGNIRTQRPLSFDDIPLLQNPMVIGHGAVANILPLDHAAYPSERGIFLASMKSAEVAQAPVSVTSKSIGLPQFLQDSINEINEL